MSFTGEEAFKYIPEYQGEGARSPVVVQYDPANGVKYVPEYYMSNLDDHQEWRHFTPQVNPVPVRREALTENTVWLPPTSPYLREPSPEIDLEKLMEAEADRNADIWRDLAVDGVGKQNKETLWGLENGREITESEMLTWLEAGVETSFDLCGTGGAEMHALWGPVAGNELACVGSDFGGLGTGEEVCMRSMDVHRVEDTFHENRNPAWDDMVQPGNIVTYGGVPFIEVEADVISPVKKKRASARSTPKARARKPQNPKPRKSARSSKPSVQRPRQEPNSRASSQKRKTLEPKPCVYKKSDLYPHFAEHGETSQRTRIDRKRKSEQSNSEERRLDRIGDPEQCLSLSGFNVEGWRGVIRQIGV